MNEYRCDACGKLLFRADFTGKVEAKCPRCDYITVSEARAVRLREVVLTGNVKAL